jgi:FkbM family methyltransferase
MLIDITKYVKKPISGIIQVGAHVGNELPTLKQLSNNILMFEPQKNVYLKLLNTINNDKEIVAENFALGSSPGIMKMYKEYANSGQSSSLMEPSLHTVQYPGITFTDFEEVEVKTLDGYMETCNKQFNLITLDVQGYELEVLKGATKTLEKIDYILCEVNRAELYKGCPMYTEIEEYLSRYGFKCEAINWEGYTWGDAFYVKNDN